MLYELMLPLKLLLCLHTFCTLLNVLYWPVKLSATFPESPFSVIYEIHIGALEERRGGGLPLVFLLCSLGSRKGRPNRGRLPSFLGLIYQWEKIPEARKVKLQNRLNSLPSRKYPNL